MARQKSLGAYEDRYKLVFAAGALHWNDPCPNPHLSRVLGQLPVHSKCIEFGCGEGYQAYLIASQGHSVTAIDLSPTAIAKGVRNTPAGQQIEFLVGDVTEASSLNLQNESYDLAVDIGCLHMMVEDDDRASYLDLVHSVLRRGGRLFLQNGLDLDDVTPGSEDEAKRLAEAKQAVAEAKKAQQSGCPTLRKIVTPDGAKQVMLPLCPARTLRLSSYIQEVESHKFRILSSERVSGSNVFYEVLLVAEKT